jgi:integrase
LIRTQYKVDGRRSVKRLETALAHLGESFGGAKAAAITSDAIVAHQARRLEAGAARASVNYELATLRRMFRLAVRHGRLRSAPAITITEPDNARAGFFEADDFAAVRAELPEYLRPVMTFAYLTGWRAKSEVLTLRWANVDEIGGVVMLEGTHTKTKKARAFPFAVLPQLAAIVKPQRRETERLERERAIVIPWLFHRHGAPIRDYKNAWARAIDRAARGGSSDPVAPITRPALVGRIVHDFRRTAVRNLVRAGVDEYLAMQLTGHKTRKVFDRYNITNETDLRAGVEKLASYLSPAPKKLRKGAAGGQSVLRIAGKRRRG